MIVASLNEKHLRLLFKTGQRGPRLCPLWRPVNNQRWKRMCACVFACLPDFPFSLPSSEKSNFLDSLKASIKGFKIIEGNNGTNGTMQGGDLQQKLTSDNRDFKIRTPIKELAGSLLRAPWWVNDDTMMFVYWSLIETCNMQCGNSHRKHTSS